jgi:hypothetical protein
LELLLQLKPDDEYQAIRWAFPRASGNLRDLNMRRVSFFLEDLPFSPIFLLLLPFLLPTSAAREGTNPPPQPNRWEQGQQIKQVKYRSQRSWPRRQLFILVGSVTLMAQIDQATNILQRGPIISKNLTLSPQIL